LNYDPTPRPSADDHPVDALIAGYAAKTLSAPLTALVAAHLELKPDNRAYVAALEAVHGVFLEDLRPVPLSGRDRRLVNIFASPEPRPEPRMPVRQASDGQAVLPDALQRLAGCGYSGLRWRNRAVGVKEALLRGAEGRFVTVRPGKRLPLRSATGLSPALVLAGRAVRGSRDFERGDIIIAAEDAEDEPIVTGDADCLCFVVAEGAAKQPGPLRRVLNRIGGG
jgi:putative transcriptional regulator